MNKYELAVVVSAKLEDSKSGSNRESESNDHSFRR